MTRLSRITSILIQLQSKRIITAKEIATRFNVSLRTIYRDIKTLQDAGVPIGSNNGVGYFIVEGFNLPPMMVTQEEVNALLVSEQLILNQGDKSLARDFRNLAVKIKAILKNYQKENLMLLEDRIGPTNESEMKESNTLSDIQKAITNFEVLQIEYFSKSSNQTTTRKVEPNAISFTEKAWYLLAFCRLRNEIREFRLDRIIKLKILPESFENNKNFNLRNYYDNMPSYS